MTAATFPRLFYAFPEEIDLHDGLYGYRAFLDAGAGSDGGSEESLAYDDAISRRLEIDACMGNCQDFVNLKHWCLLDSYFRHGRCDEARSWVMLARAINLEVKPKHLSGSKQRFDEEVCQAVRELWTVHLARQKEMV
jgi:hypothetical protein